MTDQPYPGTAPTTAPASPPQRPADTPALRAAEDALAAVAAGDGASPPEQERLLSGAQAALADLLDEDSAADAAEQP